MAEEEKLYYCKNCDAEFDPFAEDVKIMYESHGAYIIEDSTRRAHSLVLTTWVKIKRLRELGDHARPTNPFNLYQGQNEVIGDEVGITEEEESSDANL
jgi:hypothetical protein